MATSQEIVALTQAVTELAKKFTTQVNPSPPSTSTTQADPSVSGNETVKWTLLKTLCPTKLDVDTMSVMEQRSWHRQFLRYAEESQLEKCTSWPRVASGLEAAMTTSTFNRLDAMRVQELDKSVQENLSEVLKLAKRLIDGEQSLWSRRKQFHDYEQKTETVRSFYSKCMELAAECEFGMDLCDPCKPKAVELQVLQKLVFSSSNAEAQRKMFTEKTLDLQRAREILESEEAVEATEKFMKKDADGQVGGIGRNDRRSHNQTRGRGQRPSPGQRPPQGQRPPYDQRPPQGQRSPYDQRPPPGQGPCKYCGRRHERGNCPAYGQRCRKCNGYNHFERRCQNPNSGSRRVRKIQEYDEYDDYEDDDSFQMGSIVSSVMSRVMKVEIKLESELGTENLVHAVVDTGSDWCCAPEGALKSLDEDSNNLYPPTVEMVGTVNASGDSMRPLGYIKCTINFLDKESKRVFVVFPGVKDFILSKNALVELGIVEFHLGTRPDKNLKPANMATLNKVSGVTHPRSEPAASSLSSTEAPSETTSDREKMKRGPKPKLPPKPPLPEKLLFKRNQKDVKTIPYVPGNPYGKPSSEVTRLDVMREFEDVFSTHDDPMKGPPVKLTMRPDARPIQMTHSRNFPIAWKPKLKEKLEKLEAQGRIAKVPPNQPTKWVNPMVAAEKRSKPDDIRVCGDYREVNKWCERELFQSVSPVEAAQEIEREEAKFFATADGTEGFHQLLLDHESREITTIMTPFGRYYYKVAPYGINAIPEIFNHRMYMALDGIEGHVRVVDDSVVYGKDRSQLLARTRAFLQRCREQNIQLNPGKFVYGVEEVRFAGLVLNSRGYRMDEKITESIQETAIPKNISDMRSFHGTANQLGSFDAELTRKLAPLRPLLKKPQEGDKDFSMNEDQIQSFKDVKRYLSSDKIVAYYQPNQPVELFTDAACLHGFGFVLKQLQRDSTWRPIMVGSRSLIPSEKNYAPIEAEMTALEWSLKKCRKFLIGVPRFKVYTDHQPLVTIINKRRVDEVPNSRLRRKLVKIMDFNMEVVYQKGADNVTADYLSRHPTSKPDAEDIRDAEETNCQVTVLRLEAVQEAEYSPKLEEIKRTGKLDPEYQTLYHTIQRGFPQNKKDLDPAIQEYWNVKDDLNISEDGFILHGVRLVIPKTLRNQILRDLHDSHRGIVAIQNRARLVVYWPGITRQIEQACRSCEQCEKDRPSQRAEPLIHYPKPTRCFQYCSVDFAEVEGHKFLIYTDWRSGWFTVKPMKKTNAPAVIGVLRSIFVDTAVPQILFSDNGPPFDSRECIDFYRRWGIRWISSSPNYPQSNSTAENGVKSAKGLLTKCVTRRGVDMEKWSRGLLQIRNTPNPVTGLSPAVLVFGKPVQDIVPAHKSSFEKSWQIEVNDYDQKIAEEQQRMDRYRPGTPLPDLKVNTPVAVQDVRSKKWNKFGVIQEANYQIRKYVIRLPSGLLVTRNRRFIKRRYPDIKMNGGTKLWDPTGKFDKFEKAEEMDQGMNENFENENDAESDSDSEEEERNYNPMRHDDRKTRKEPKKNNKPTVLRRRYKMRKREVAHPYKLRERKK